VTGVPPDGDLAVLAEVQGVLTRTRPSDGFVHAMPARAVRAVRDANMLIRALVITAAVLSADGTPIRVGPGRRPARSTCWSPALTC
jgi:hypothetical protein